MTFRLSLKWFNVIFLIPYALISLFLIGGVYLFEKQNLESTLFEVVSGDMHDLGYVVSSYLEGGKEKEIQAFLDMTLISHPSYESISVMLSDHLVQSTNRSLQGKPFDLADGIYFKGSTPDQLFSGLPVILPFSYFKKSVSVKGYLIVKFDHGMIYQKFRKNLELILFLSLLTGLFFYLMHIYLINLFFMVPIKQLQTFALGGKIPDRLQLQELEVLKDRLVSGFQNMEKTNRQLNREIQSQKEKNRESKEMLIQQSRLALLGEMFGVIAHQWRQPLNTLGLMIQDIPESVQSGEFDKKAADRFSSLSMDQVFFMSRTIDDFRDLVRPADPSKPEYFFPGQAIDEVLSLMDAQLKNRRILVDNIVETTNVKEMVCTGYLNEFKHVVLNLISNARNIIQEKRARGETNGGFIRIRQFVKSNGYTCMVEDDAGGIPEELHEKIFEPYFTTRPGKGSGIGLYIVRVIIEERMGGRVTVRNTEQGALFTIELPFIEKPTDEINMAVQARQAKNPLFLN